jgi:hypothetical protein
MPLLFPPEKRAFITYPHLLALMQVLRRNAPCCGEYMSMWRRRTMSTLFRHGKKKKVYFWGRGVRVTSHAMHAAITVVVLAIGVM